jgi:hypothetical protein
MRLAGKAAIEADIRDCWQRLSSRNAQSSSFPRTVAGVVTKAANTCETPEPT